MDNEILDFIHRRFSGTDWNNGNCYWAAKILSNAFPRLGVYYDSTEGHFVAGCLGHYYDCTGEVTPIKPIPLWEIRTFDEEWYSRLERDCIK